MVHCSKKSHHLCVKQETTDAYPTIAGEIQETNQVILNQLAGLIACVRNTRAVRSEEEFEAK